MSNLQNKVLVITGASQGLGRTLALLAAKEGARVALVARSEDRLKAVKQEILEKGGESEYFVCDIQDLSSIKETVDKIVKHFKTIDILVNNAGIWTTNEIEKNDPEKRKQAFEINALGTINFSFEVLPIFKNKNSGYFFNIISTSGESDLTNGDNKDWMTYGATKWAVRGFTKALKRAVIETKIKVTAFFPGGMDTNIFENAGIPDFKKPQGLMKAEDVAEIIIFALTRPEDILLERILVTKV